MFICTAALSLINTFPWQSQLFITWAVTSGHRVVNDSTFREATRGKRANAEFYASAPPDSADNFTFLSLYSGTFARRLLTPSLLLYLVKRERETSDWVRVICFTLKTSDVLSSERTGGSLLLSLSLSLSLSLA